ncbi:Aste57867_23976 [Aphanomyces stellatus]|uniref:Aste57867_23976 protein n=1 Tax=Aphanomyces stellatus TaxID=120398 RepID=A0A485LQA4_9STRA|nr:hypothetical protein As57867_023903 [Aphanomyces stellatus]VFU00619.1 Aste57867_23976 [Aphanomyces stellatus]
MLTYSADEWTWRALPASQSRDTSLLSPASIAHLNATLRHKSAAEIVAWAHATFGPSLALSSSFGMQSAVMLHLVTHIAPAIPVVWVDTGYLPPETYAFAAALTQRFRLNLHTTQATMSAARMEALHGKLWGVDASADAHRLYGRLRKVEPMERALRELNTTALLVGLRADQTTHRQGLDVVHVHKGRLKICPILHWSDANVDAYMAAHDLPYHPLKDLGYHTVGDAHSSRPVTADDGDNVRATRFHGKTQECGLHVDDDNNQRQDDDDNISMNEPIPQLLVDNQHKDNHVVTIYSKPTCKYCVLAKEALTQVGVAYKDVTVGIDIDYAALCRIVGKPVHSVPQIFIHKRYIGGYDQLMHVLAEHTMDDRQW